MKQIYEQHIDFFHDHAILLCGAGISMKSGIPNVFPFTKHLLKKLGASAPDIKTFLNSGFPFEAMMEVMKTRVNIFDLLSLFNVINLNNNHRLIAHLASIGWLKIIITTNFDRNIETALDQSGLSRDADYNVRFDLDNVVPADLDSKIIVLKLHGSIEDQPSILSTITGVANKVNQERMIKFFNLLFASADFDQIITWGYSFSDHFDIRPALKRINPSGKHIYSVRYQGSKEKEIIADNSSDILFSQFTTATNWQCSLDKIVKQISQKTGLKQITVIPSKWKRKMNDILKREISGKGLHNKHGILAALFQSAGRTTIALKYADIGLNKIKRRKPDQLLRMDLTAAIGKAYIRDPNNRKPLEALKYLEDARDIAKVLKMDDYVRIYTADIGSCYQMLLRYPEAEAPYIDVIKHYKSLLSNPVERAAAIDKIYGYQIMLAHCYSKQGKFTEGLSLYQETLQGCILEGQLFNQELCMAGLGLAHAFSNNPSEGLSFFEEGYKLAVLNGAADRIKSQFLLCCSWSWTVHGESYAQIFYDSEFAFVNEKTGFNKTLSEIGPGLTGSID